MATNSEPSNKPKLANLDAFSITNGKHSIVYVNTSFSNRQAPEICVKGFHDTSKSASFYLLAGQEEGLRYAISKAPLLPVDITFNGMDGKTIGYYKGSRSSNEGGGNVKSTSLNPQTMQDFFTLCDFNESNDYYIMLPSLRFYSDILTPDIISRVMEHDFSAVPNVTDIDNKVHIFIDSKFFEVSKFDIAKDDKSVTELLDMDLDYSIRKYLQVKPNKFSVLWLTHMINKGFIVHLCENDSMISIATQYAFGMKSEDKTVAFNEFMHMDTSEGIIHAESSSNILKVYARSGGRINLSTTSSGFENLWLMAVIPGEVKNVTFLDKEVTIRSPSENELKELGDNHMENSLQMYQYVEDFSKILDEDTRETKNQMLLKHATQIVETLHCRTLTGSKKVRFETPKEAIHPLKKLTRSLYEASKQGFIDHINRLSDVHNMAPIPPVVARQMSCGAPRYPHSEATRSNGYSYNSEY
ncbi:hypothetical protein CPAV1605_370 [seawater metagenome]|uniref:Uncharacterized protein n=1 Tax=seawater metagenome TaxID=1561972 RepID=A0A5E8CL66_9ZZZZ